MAYAIAVGHGPLQAEILRIYHSRWEFNYRFLFISESKQSSYFRPNRYSGYHTHLSLA